MSFTMRQQLRQTGTEGQPVFTDQRKGSWPTERPGVLTNTEHSLWTARLCGGQGNPPLALKEPVLTRESHGYTEDKQWLKD